MARLITNNIISAPTGMNSKYWEDYLDAAKSRGDVFKGVGETLQGVEDGVTDYIKYKNEKAKEERQRAREDRADAMNEERFAMDKNTYTQNVADRTKREKAVSAYLADPNHDPAFDSMEGKAALDNYIVNGGNSIENFRAGLTNAALIKQQKKEEEDLKASEKALKDANEALRKEVASIDMPLTSKQWESLENKDELKELLKKKKSEAIALGNRELQKDIEESLKALYEGSERQTAKNTSTEKKKEDNQKKKDRAARL